MNKPLIVAVGAAAAVVLVAGLIWVTVGGRGGSGPAPASASAAVQEYLEALAAGDAAAALAYSDDQPASTELLNDEVLAQQLAKGAITNITIVSDDTVGGVATVRVKADFGSVTSDAILLVSKNDSGRWRLPTAAVKLAGSDSGMVPPEAAKTATVFGHPLPPEGAYVFPGFVEMASTSPYVEVGVARPLLLDTLNLPAEQIMYAPGKFDISDMGRQAVRETYDAGLAACRDSNLVSPDPPCPVALDHSFTDNGARDYDITYGDADSSGMQIRFDPASMIATLSGRSEIQVSYRHLSGRQVTTTGYSDSAVYDVDVSVTPPVLTGGPAGEEPDQ
ncbi:MAG: hypothetical protein K0U84_09200 [Actinomycetia bacterium]|nr:hypothetical protein [Actinomycetes bacterium]